jgi:hypothetical protein
MLNSLTHIHVFVLYLPQFLTTSNYRISKKHSRCFDITSGHGNFAFKLVVKLSDELGCFSKFEVILVSFTTLQEKNNQTSREIQQHLIVVFNDIRALSVIVHTNS